MKINGYGEFNQMRRLVQKDEEKTSGRDAKKAPVETPPAKSENGDAVQISQESRMRGKLRLIPEAREAVIARVQAKMDAGTLVTDESLRSGGRKMLESNLGEGF